MNTSCLNTSRFVYFKRFRVQLTQFCLLPYFSSLLTIFTKFSDNGKEHFKMKNFIAVGVTSALLMFSHGALANSTKIETINHLKGKVMNMQSPNLQAGKNTVFFKSQGVQLAGHLYLPEGFDSNATYPSVEFSPPFNQVKEQTGAVYAEHLAKRGYITIVFDHLGYGDSEGDIRNNENSFIKIESIRDAVSYMGTLPFVDKEQLFGLGVCASGGYMALVATTDKRLKAIATVSGMMGNKASYFETMDRETITGLIAMQNAGRQKAYETGEAALENIHIHQIERAKNLLLGSDDSVSTIAYALGFEYPQYFSRLFKNKVGLTPTQYRNQTPH